ncbi:MAG: hypothetical protein DMF99_21200 [Acidobacteria bacterium]|nr:MAG: hypothetical protein DMF99_21200 [Acidobacteriota bacterium]
MAGFTKNGVQIERGTSRRAAAKKTDRVSLAAAERPSTPRGRPAAAATASCRRRLQRQVGLNPPAADRSERRY